MILCHIGRPALLDSVINDDWAPTLKLSIDTDVQPCTKKPKLSADVSTLKYSLNYIYLFSNQIWCNHLIEMKFYLYFMCLYMINSGKYRVL